MSTDQAEYEIFISYARLDNHPIPVDYPQGWVSAVVQKIVEDHRQYETSSLRIFFDIREMKVTSSKAWASSKNSRTPIQPAPRRNSTWQSAFSIGSLCRRR